MVTEGHEGAEHEIDRAPIGGPGRHARQEIAGLVLYLTSIAVFLAWLIRFGVNV